MISVGTFLAETPLPYLRYLGFILEDGTQTIVTVLRTDGRLGNIVIESASMTNPYLGSCCGQDMIAWISEGAFLHRDDHVMWPRVKAEIQSAIAELIATDQIHPAMEQIYA